MVSILSKPDSGHRRRHGVGGPVRIIFAGNPNCGKTTLFNRLTGLRAKTANYPGTTVELRRAVQFLCGEEVEFIDLPGMYGLAGFTPEEKIAAGFLEECTAEGEGRSLVVLVVDATRLSRNLYLVSQVREKVPSMVVALNMTDLAEREGTSFDMEALEKEIGAPVIPLSARTGMGVDHLRAEIEGWLEENAGVLRHCAPCSFASVCCEGCPHRARYQWAEEVDRRVSRRSATWVAGKWTGRIDRWTTHPWIGLGLFVLVMAFLFQALFHLAEIPMEWIDGGFGFLQGLAADVLPKGYFSSFVVDGLLTGLGGMVMFLPQICILFFLLSLLEDTGYLARAAFVADRWMSRVGLPGKAFLPILSAHACAIPAVMSTRTIEDPKDRLVANLVIPLFTCSARIPVYVMVTAMLFPHSPRAAGLVFTGAYFLGIVAAFLTAFILRGSLIKGRPQPLLIELPGYKFPSLRTALLTMADRGGLFLRRAGTLIVAIVAVLWLLTQVPVLPEETAGDSGIVPDADQVEAGHAQRQLEYSVVGRAGHFLEPVFAPLGFDWRITVGVLTSFAAREVVVSTLSVLYGLGDEGEDEPESIAALLRSQLPPAAGLSLLVFFVLAMQCLPTQIVVRRETGHWKWPLLQLAYMSALAYTAAFVTYQMASRFWT